jgi:putative endonuclease
VSGPADARGRGQWAEEQALGHLTRHGLRLLQRNFRCRLGELDLIMADGPVVVFVEVRFRSGSSFGAGFETVTRAKQRRIMAAARAYLARHRSDEAPCRFDVVSVTQRNYAPIFLWVKEAFNQDD